MDLSFPELSFEPKKHVYKLNGILIPSVSEIMRPLSTAEYGTIDENILAQAAERGSSVHEAIENYIKFEIEDCDPAYQAYFDAFLSWKARYGVEIVASETAVYHKAFMYAGTVDILCMIKDALWLVDIKTTAKLNRMLTDVQLTAYNQALASHNVKTDHKAVLLLKKDGSVLFEPVDDDPKPWATFGALLTVYGHIQRHRRK